MKKTILLLSSILIHQASFAQYESTSQLDNNPAIGILIVALIILGGIMLIIRSVLLRYWKITTIVKNQEETNRVLKNIFNEMQKQSK